MPPRKAAAPSRVYQLKATLMGLKPPIWRRVEVADDVTLAKLHLAQSNKALRRLR